MQIVFVADKTHQQVGEAYAADAVNLARDTYKKNLDFSDGSIVLVEEILGLLHLGTPHTDPSPEKAFEMAKVFGSYVGEVFRRRYGAEWGMVTLNGQQLPGLRALQSGKIFWPWGKVSNRIEDGPEDS